MNMKEIYFISTSQKFWLFLPKIDLNVSEEINFVWRERKIWDVNIIYVALNFYREEQLRKTVERKFLSKIESVRKQNGEQKCFY